MKMGGEPPRMGNPPDDYGNMTLCEENCDFVNYNPNIEKVKCSCDIKTNIQ